MLDAPNSGITTSSRNELIVESQEGLIPESKERDLFASIVANGNVVNSSVETDNSSEANSSYFDSAQFKWPAARLSKAASLQRVK